MAAHLRQAAKSGARVPEAATAPLVEPPPAGFEFVWSVFLDLNTGRQGGMGPLPIAWSDVEAYCRMTGVRLEEWELNAVRRLDAKWLEVTNGHMKDEMARKKQK